MNNFKYLPLAAIVFAICGGLAFGLVSSCEGTSDQQIPFINEEFTSYVRDGVTYVGRHNIIVVPDVNGKTCNVHIVDPLMEGRTWEEVTCRKLRNVDRLGHRKTILVFSLNTDSELIVTYEYGQPTSMLIRLPLIQVTLSKESKN